MTEYTVDTAWAELDATTKAIIEADYQRRKEQLERDMARWREIQERIARLDEKTEILIQEMGW